MKKLIVVIILGGAMSLHAEILVPFQASNKLTATVIADITQDPSTHLYTYSYTILNDASSEQAVDNFAFEIDESTPAVEVSAPTGWSFGRYTHKNLYEFSSTEGITEEHVVILPNGAKEVRSPYDVQPGDSLCCFVFKTFSSPEPGNVYIQGYVPDPQSTGGAEPEPDFSDLGIASDSIEDNSFVTTARVPKGTFKKTDVGIKRLTR